MNTNTLTAGQILYSSWGYDQTNINFYQVHRATGKTAWVIPLPTVKTEDGYMTGTAMPGEADETAPVIQRKIHRHRLGLSIRIEEYEGASPWDGKPKRFSTYG
jgi:hypothetical protein